MRKPYIAGNWKMNLDRRGARDLAGTLREHTAGRDDVEVAVFPPFLYLGDVLEVAGDSALRVGAQNCCDQTEGAFTGEVSTAMLRDVGIGLCLLGHSERRHVYGESDELVGRKVKAALAAGLEVMLCIGEIGRAHV
jgi:triosephosphate isomerase